MMCQELKTLSLTSVSMGSILLFMFMCTCGKRLDKELSEYPVKEDDALKNLTVVPISKKEAELVGNYCVYRIAILHYTGTCKLLVVYRTYLSGCCVNCICIFP